MKLNPYLLFAGNAEEVLNFYKNALGGEVEMMSRYKDSPMPSDEDYKDKIMHARYVFGDGNILMISDSSKGDLISTNGNIQLSVEIGDPVEIENVFNKMAEGGTVTLPMSEQFWGAKFGMLQDKFGISWMFNCQLKK